jgi:hypothetical protein
VRAFLHHPLYDPLALQSEDTEFRLCQEKMLQSYQTYLPKYHGNKLDTEGHQRNPVCQKWYGCVAQFTKHNLTFHRDALPTMSGFAKQMHKAIGAKDAYDAGLWENSLIRGLLWAVFYIPKVQPLAEFTAPSFS